MVFVDKHFLSRSVLLSILGGEKCQTLVLKDNLFFSEGCSVRWLVGWVGDIYQQVSSQQVLVVAVFPLSAHYRLKDKCVGPRRTPN